MIIVLNLHASCFIGSQDCVHWGLLPVVTESMRHNCSFVKGRFTGDPSYEYEHTETKKVENQDGDKVDGAEEENIVCEVLNSGCNENPGGFIHLNRDIALELSLVLQHLHVVWY